LVAPTSSLQFPAAGTIKIKRPIAALYKTRPSGVKFLALSSLHHSGY
jgi:hypothetical protein